MRTPINATFKKALILLSALLLLLPPAAWAWSYRGHVLIAQIAYDNLTPPEQAKANALTLFIFSQLPPLTIGGY